MGEAIRQGRTIAEPAANDCGGAFRPCLARAVHTLRAVVADRAGATAIEYGIIAVLIAVGAMTVVKSLGDSENDSFATLSTGLDTSSHSILPPLANKPQPDPWAATPGQPSPKPHFAAPPMGGAMPPVPPDPGGTPSGPVSPGAAPAAAADPAVSGPVQGQTGTGQMMVNASAAPSPTQ